MRCRRRFFAHGCRASPAGLWPAARTAIVCGLNYGPEQDPLGGLERTDRGYLSVYARHRDYHDVLKGRLKELAGWLAARFACEVKVFVDTAPVLEKPLAQRAGLGWQGKHTNLVSREFGSWLFLGEILTDLELPADQPERDHCGRCRSCLDACPTEAFPAPYRLDARRCISYLTIEHKGPIPRALRPLLGNRIYGCDDCLAVCPWNKFADTAARHKAFLPRGELVAPALADLLALDDAGFRQVFAGSPIKRIGRGRMVRNAAIAAGNSGDARFRARLEALTQDESPMVADAAAWALAEATCRSSELPNISGDNVDLDSGRLWIGGGKATEPREGRLTAWGLTPTTLAHATWLLRWRRITTRRAEMLMAGS